MKLQLIFVILVLSGLLYSCNSQSTPSETPEAEAAPAGVGQEARSAIRTAEAPEPVGPYSQAVMAGNTLYLAGQIAIDPASGEMVNDSIEAEARQVMTNLQAILREAGMDTENVVKTTIYMTDLENFGKVNEIYGSYFGDMPPARVTVGVAALPKGASLEIAMIAVR
jgi:2-iminobutanoate/2-iminopropanoate deaminase